MQNSIIVQATVVRQDQHRYEWLASALLRERFKPLWTQTYVSSTIIAIEKWGFYGHCMLRVANLLQTILFIMPTTCMLYVHLSLLCTLYHLNTILALLSATGATTGKNARAWSQNTHGQLWLRLKTITDLITTSILNRPFFPRN